MATVKSKSNFEINEFRALLEATQNTLAALVATDAATPLAPVTVARLRQVKAKLDKEFPIEEKFEYVSFDEYLSASLRDYVATLGANDFFRDEFCESVILDLMRQHENSNTDSFVGDPPRYLWEAYRACGMNGSEAAFNGDLETYVSDQADKLLGMETNDNG